MSLDSDHEYSSYDPGKTVNDLGKTGLSSVVKMIIAVAIVIMMGGVTAGVVVGTSVLGIPHPEDDVAKTTAKMRTTKEISFGIIIFVYYILI